LVISGGRFDTVTGNQFWNNNSWAILTVPFIDTGTPPPIAHCDGGVPNYLGLGWCLYNAWGNEISNNSFANNGGYGNPTNGDLADISDPLPAEPGNCYHGNVDKNGTLSSAPTNIQSSMGSCGVLNQGGLPLNLGDVVNPDPNSLVSQVVCASGVFGPCQMLPSPPFPPNTLVGTYPPTSSTPVLPALDRQRTMPDPCAGVPDNPWCHRHGGRQSRDDHQGEGHSNDRNSSPSSTSSASASRVSLTSGHTGASDGCPGCRDDRNGQWSTGHQSGSCHGPPVHGAP
jgi:hypothetical protein